MLIGAFIGLAYSKKEENETIKIFHNQVFTLKDRFIQPFRMHQNEEINMRARRNQGQLPLDYSDIICYPSQTDLTPILSLQRQGNHNL